ncbi:hypothetical protein DIPPA_05228 [Diplonema papillatum]|nr:hypothetical protein DIPPA_28224 [Diplonema papillatum]KAJ9471464.1 hypothetical protein DIPPA_05228 [Diplonema papillatum]
MIGLYVFESKTPIDISCRVKGSLRSTSEPSMLRWSAPPSSPVNVSVCTPPSCRSFHSVSLFFPVLVFDARIRCASSSVIESASSNSTSGRHSKEWNARTKGCRQCVHVSCCSFSSGFVNEHR